jgi:serine protease Do
MNRLLRFGAITLFAIVFTGTTQSALLGVGAPNQSGAHAGSDGGVEQLRQTGKAFASVAKAVSPSVVFIQVEGKTSAQQAMPFGEDWAFGDDFLRRFFGEPLPRIPRGEEMPKGRQQVVSQGSGFVFNVEDTLFTDKTYILTNNHVVQGADKIKVTFLDGRAFEAKVTGRDPQSDLAVIEINAKGLPRLPLGDSSKLEVGEWVVAIGNPFGLSHSLTAGVVSATQRTSVGINDYEDFIQTDAAINPGNSGGPLVNLSGEVVGINTAIFSRTGGYMGIGFAIPINMAKDVANQLMEKGEVTRGYLGIVVQPLTPELAGSFGIKDNQGILVAEVGDDSAAAKAGLRPGDVIVAFRDKPVTDVGDFRNRVSLTPPGKTAMLTIIRDGRRQDVSVTVRKRDEEEVAASAVQSEDELGLTVQTLTPDLASQFNAEAGEGVIVTSVKPDSVAALAGIDPGTVILQINHEPIKSVAEFKRAIKLTRTSKRVLMLIRSGDAQRYVVLSW